jgi:predicted nucleic acid-binding protein
LKKLKLYLDTSVISHLFAEDAPDKMADTLRLWEELAIGKFDVFVSTLTLEEVQRCAEPKRGWMVKKLDEIEYQILSETAEVSELAGEYLANEVLTKKSADDCMHIAYAVVGGCDIIASWNFKHLVNYKTINKVKIVNAMNQYREISIMSPTMLVVEEGEE